MALTLSQLRKQYVGPDGSVVPVVDIEHFHLADGEQLALVGTSGSGKTTLLHLIAGILTPDSGRIVFDFSGEPLPGAAKTQATTTGTSANVAVAYATPNVASYGPGAVNIVGLSEAERDVFRGRHIGYIFQTHHLLAGFTALENVLLGMSFTGRKHDTGWATHLLNEVGLSQRLDYKPEKLSVGQQQRVAVARALANRPKLVLADEPTGALDATNAQQVLDLIRKLCDEVKAALLLVSHDAQMTRQLPRSVSLADLNRASTVVNW
ncbi:MAG TPA: ABC transporter ATP-binding protein [Tepidisphaeraceae bacterium]|nr:ABC transporter ATP-binding protein [Tepidisphaeraceae bacterium]